jgi:hypothetical protein
MKLTYGKFVQALYLVLFAVSSILSLFQFHTNAVKIAGLSLLGFIVFDILCYFRKKIPAVPRDLAPELERVAAKNAELEAKMNLIVNDIGLAKISATIRR